MPHDQPDALVRILVDALASSSAEVSQDRTLGKLPDKWLQVLPSDEFVLQSEQEDQSTDSASDQVLGDDRCVPPATEAWRLNFRSAGSRYFILAPIESLKLSSGDAANALMAAVRLRTRLLEDERTDLYLLMIAPPGSDRDVSRRKSAMQMELNESFCRIFTWLPGEVKDQWPSEARSFSRRLFLTRLPIAEGQRGDIAPLSSLFHSLPLLPATRIAWEEILLQDDLGGRTDSNKAIAEALVDSISAMENDDE